MGGGAAPICGVGVFYGRDDHKTNQLAESSTQRSRVLQSPTCSCSAQIVGPLDDPQVSRRSHPGGASSVRGTWDA